VIEDSFFILKFSFENDRSAEALLDVSVNYNHILIYFREVITDNISSGVADFAAIWYKIY
jgi:hypothetical protein